LQKWRQWFFSSILICMLLTIRCAGLLKSRKPLTDLPVCQLIQEIQENASQIKTFQGQGRFLAVSKETAMGGGIRVYARMPDSLWIKVEGPLGVDVATGWFGGGQALWYVPMDGVVFSGPMESVRDLDIIPVDMGSSNMILSIIGLAVPHSSAQDSLYALKTEGRKYVIYSDDESIRVNPKGPVVTQWEMIDFQGNLLWQWEGENMKKDRGIYFPGTIRFTRWQPKERITIFYENIKINKPLHQSWFQIDIPKGVRRIEL